MIDDINKELRGFLGRFPRDDKIILNNETYDIDESHFQQINPANGQKEVAFIDGGQAEIISAGNICLSFIRVMAIIMKGTEKVASTKKEFFLLTTAAYDGSDILYKSRIFGDHLIPEQDLVISSRDASIRLGRERASISKIAGIARRFSELAMASLVQADFIMLDGTLEVSFPNEEKYLQAKSLCALAKSSSLFTTSGNSPVVVLNKMGQGKWLYAVNEQAGFVKLHPSARHVFRFEGNREVLPYLLENSGDAAFLGYPYGFILADRLARVSNEEKRSLTLKFLLNKENEIVLRYLTTADAHAILDHLG